VRLVRLEKDRALSVLVDPVNLAIISGGDVEASLRVERHVPDVLGFRIEESVCGELRSGGRAA
jgi:hypothetical protein